MSKTCKFEEKILLILSKQVGTDYSAAIAKAIAEDGYLRALKLGAPKPQEYSHPDIFRADYLCYSYLSKFEGYVDTDNLADEAISSFLQTEQVVGKVNHFLAYGSAKSGVEGIISDARRKVIRILDRVDLTCDKFPYKEFIEGCDWGPGATATLKSRDARLDKKILERPLSVTSRALPYMRSYISYDTSMGSARLGFQAESYSPLPCEFQVVEYDRFTTVPKNWKTRRSIAIQPTANLFLQKGIGRMIRNRLRRDGIDLDDQSRNQILASRAFKDGYATIDLAKASDSVSSELVDLLLPPSWVIPMRDLRTRFTKIGDHMHHLNKFSAMGNGFTFELESLIFYSLLYATIRCEARDFESEIAVYGDDLIVHQKHFKRVVEVLNYCGFSINDDKSFSEGHFFESCGKHYFGGFDVTPVFQKKIVNSLPEAMRCSNRLFRWAHFSEGFLDRRVRLAWEASVSYADRFLDFGFRKKLKVLPRAPYYLEGDDYILWPDFVVPRNRSSTYRIKAISFAPEKIRADGYALLSYSLKRVVTDSPFRDFLSLRGFGKYRYSTRLVLGRGTDVLSWI
jgi:hypothetical protein